MGEVIAFVFIAAIGGLLAWFIIKIPISIAENRSVKPETLASIRLLSILGLFLGIPWVVAVCWACIAPPEEFPDDDLGLAREKNRTLDAPTAAQRDKEVAVATDKCENCGRSIGNLETPHVWQDHVVCADCIKRLETAKVP